MQACVRAAQGRPELASKELERLATKCPAWPKTGETLGGWLRRDRRGVAAPQRRWFFLKDKFLFWYREPTDSTPLGGYVVENATAGQTPLGDARDLTSFTFTMQPSIDFILDALEAKPRAEWITVLTNANLIDPFEKNKLYFPDSAEWNTKATSKDIATTTLQGFLYKRGNANTDWKMRWCALRGTLLVYSEKEDSKVLGSIDIRNCKVRQAVDEGAEYPFQLITPIRTYFLNSESAETTRAWVIAIFDAQEHATKITTTGIYTPTDTPFVVAADTDLKDKRKTIAVPKPASSSANSDSPTASPSTPTLSDSPKRSTVETSSPQVAIGRRWGETTRGPTTAFASTSSSREAAPSSVSSYFSSSYERPSSLKSTPSAPVELTDLRSPSMSALAALNEEEEARRNMLAKEARRTRVDRTHSELLSEPLLADGLDVDQDEENDFQPNRSDNSGCCTIL